MGQVDESNPKIAGSPEILSQLDLFFGMMWKNRHLIHEAEPDSDAEADTSDSDAKPERHGLSTFGASAYFCIFMLTPCHQILR